MICGDTCRVKWRREMTDGETLNNGDLWEEYYTNLHHAHRALREMFVRSGMTQEQLADRLNVDKALISKRLNGNENLTLRTLSFMASAMQCRLSIEPVPYSNVQAPAICTSESRTGVHWASNERFNQRTTNASAANVVDVPRMTSRRGVAIGFGIDQKSGLASRLNLELGGRGERKSQAHLEDA